ncbi:MAG: hypothetical protein AB1418_10240 [Pseudomonadota bacterium]|jgi:hypothetical protein
MKKLLFAALLLSGCGTFATSQMQTYRAPGQSEAWHIAGRIEEMTQVLTITVNGQDAVSGKLSIWNGLGSVSGEYQGRPISATCNKVRQQRQCQVVVGSEIAATLVF